MYTEEVLMSLNRWKWTAWDLQKLLKEYAQNHHGWVEGNELAFTPMTDYFKAYLLK